MKIERDKLYHFAAGAAVYLAIAYTLGPVAGILAAIVAGLVKEVYDVADSDRRLADGQTPRHTPEPADFAATTLGGLAGFALEQGILAMRGF